MAKRQLKPVPMIGADTSAMSDAEVFDYYKATALQGNAAFFVRTQTATATADQIDAMFALYLVLCNRKATADDKRVYTRIMDSWRRDRLVADFRLRRKPTRRAAKAARLAAAIERHRQADPHCSCGACIEAMESEAAHA